jgi:release factor glutamine methyltransferase
MTLQQALAAAGALGLDRLDAMVLLAHYCACPREWIIAHGEAELSPTLAPGFRSACERRADGVPLAYLTGTREFYGLTLRVTPSVLVPRPETETLAHWAVELLHSEPLAHRAPRVVDLGTGSGALALAMAANCPHARVTATDRSAAALDVARGNATQLALPLRLAQGTWWQAIAGERFDLAVANPPYVAPGDPHLRALRHEPTEALVAQDHGLAAIRDIVSAAPDHLSGWLLLEHGRDQADSVRAMLVTAGFDAIQTREDLNGHPRCTGGRIQATV